MMLLNDACMMWFVDLSVLSWEGETERGLSWCMKGPLAMNSYRRVNVAVMGF